jgi:hypothetical protein
LLVGDPCDYVVTGSVCVQKVPKLTPRDDLGDISIVRVLMSPPERVDSGFGTLRIS